jgi:predicted nucleic acid-binding Zn finger protein
MDVLTDILGELTSSTAAQITLQQQFCPCSKMQFNVMHGGL